MSTALGEMAKIELIFGEDQFRKWFKGDPSLQMICGKRPQVSLMRRDSQERCREN